MTRPLDFSLPTRFREAVEASKVIPTLKAPGAIRLQTSKTIRLIRESIGGPKRVAPGVRA